MDNAAFQDRRSPFGKVGEAAHSGMGKVSRGRGDGKARDDASCLGATTPLALVRRRLLP